MKLPPASDVTTNVGIARLESSPMNVRVTQPDVARIIRSLERLTDAITIRGGQRRARPYVATQLRRLRRR